MYENIWCGLSRAVVGFGTGKRAECNLNFIYLSKWLFAYSVYADNFLSAYSVYADNFLSAYSV